MNHTEMDGQQNIEFLYTAWFNFSITTVSIYGSVRECAEKFVHGSICFIVNQYCWKHSV